MRPGCSASSRKRAIGRRPSVTSTARRTRREAFAFGGKEQDIRAIASTLPIRVTAQLIAADDGTHLFSERYDREMADVFAMQDEIAAAITATLRVTLTGAPAAPRHMPKLPAYDAYLRALSHQAKVTPESLEAATTRSRSGRE
jgi:hypothetical protein